VGQAVVIDGSSSYSEDFTSLFYTWSCAVATLDASFGSSCGSNFPDGVTSSKYVIPANTMKKGQKYDVKMTVTASDGRVSSLDVTILANSALVAVSISQASRQVNTQDKLVLVGTMKSNFSVAAYWSVYISSQAINATGAITKLSQRFTSSEAKNGISYPLAFVGARIRSLLMVVR